MMVDPTVLYQSGGALVVVGYLLYTNHQGKVAQMAKHVNVQTVIVRAMARTNEDVDTELVDEYLNDNGVTPEDFIRDAN